MKDLIVEGSTASVTPDVANCEDVKVFNGRSKAETGLQSDPNSDTGDLNSSSNASPSDVPSPAWMELCEVDPEHFRVRPGTNDVWWAPEGLFPYEISKPLYREACFWWMHCQLMQAVIESGNRPTIIMPYVMDAIEYAYSPIGGLSETLLLATFIAWKRALLGTPEGAGLAEVIDPSPDSQAVTIKETSAVVGMNKKSELK